MPKSVLVIVAHAPSAVILSGENACSQPQHVAAKESGGRSGVSQAVRSQS